SINRYSQRKSLLPYVVRFDTTTTARSFLLITIERITTYKIKVQEIGTVIEGKKKKFCVPPAGGRFCCSMFPLDGLKKNNQETEGSAKVESSPRSVGAPCL